MASDMADEMKGASYEIEIANKMNDTTDKTVIGNLIQSYGKMRKLKIQNTLASSQNMHREVENVIRVMQYNVLADGNAYALHKHMDYVEGDKANNDPLAFRKWSYRGPRILAQILCYMPDIICLQETTHKTYSEYFEPELAKAGYSGAHGVRDLEAVKHGDLSRMTDAMFFNKNKFQLMDVQCIGLNEVTMKKRKEYQSQFGASSYAQNYPFLDKLQTRCDIFMVFYLRIIKTEKPLIAVCSHLYHNDTFAHTKLAQSLLINRELNKMISMKWRLNANQVPIVFGVDANSNVYKSKFDSFYDEKHPTLSGVYQLMTTARVCKQHVDHPFTRCKLLFDEGMFDKQPFGKKSNDQFKAYLRGLPWAIRHDQIKAFFAGQDMIKIDILFRDNGKPRGTAIVQFADEQSLNAALKKDRHFIGNRYIEVSRYVPNKSTGNEEEDKYKIAKRNVFGQKNGPRYVLKIVGLPWSARQKEIAQFFKDELIINTVIVYLRDGRPSGYAFVEFADAQSYESAKSRNRVYLDNRFLELYETSPDEIDRAAGILKTDFVQPMIDDWHSPLIWKSAYKEACGFEPIMTTKSPDYWGVSDYIFISRNCTALSYLELPYHDENVHRGNQNSEQFPTFPNKDHPSDHLPLVCDIRLPN